MTSLKEALNGKLTQNEQQHLRRSFDLVGDIAILEIPPELKKKEKTIADTLLNLHKNINVVAVKRSGHAGKYRKQKLDILAGEQRLETTHKESGCRFFLDVSTCYFSPRLGKERLRISRLVKKEERVLIVGGGVGPYAIVIAKHSPAKEIISVEANPSAHKYATHNIALNKLIGRVRAIKGDIRKTSNLGTFDRIISVIPHEGVNIAPALLRFSKKGTILHVYDFTPEEALKEPAQKLKALCNKHRKPCRILRTVKAGQHAVRQYRVCIDAKRT